MVSTSNLIDKETARTLIIHESHVKSVNKDVIQLNKYISKDIINHIQLIDDTVINIKDTIDGVLINEITKVNDEYVLIEARFNVVTVLFPPFVLTPDEYKKIDIFNCYINDDNIVIRIRDTQINDLDVLKKNIYFINHIVNDKFIDCFFKVIPKSKIVFEFIKESKFNLLGESYCKNFKWFYGLDNTSSQFLKLSDSPKAREIKSKELGLDLTSDEFKNIPLISKLTQLEFYENLQTESIKTLQTSR